jgi:hypothetical protein
MKNDVFWDIKTKLVPHRRYYISAAEPSRLMLCKIQVFTAVTMKNAVFWDKKSSSYLTGDIQTLHPRYRAQTVNVI